MVYHRCLRDGLNYPPEESHDFSLFNTQLPTCVVQARPTFLLAERTSRRVAGHKMAGAKQDGWLSHEVVTRGTCCTCGCTMAPWTGAYHSPVTWKMLLSGITGKENKRQVNITTRAEGRLIGLFHLLYLTIYVMLFRAYRRRNRTYLPQNRLFQFIKMGGSLLSDIFYFKMFIGCFH